MLEIYEASHGGLATIPHELASFESLDHLLGAVSDATGVPIDNALLFLEDGRDVRDEILHELWERGGEGSQSVPPTQRLFLFNRDTFYAETPEHWAAQFQEDLILPPALNLTAISDLALAQQPFLIALDHLHHLSALLYAQTRALHIAYASLATYLEPLLAEFELLRTRAADEFGMQSRLIRSSVADMAVLRKIPVLDALARRKDKERDRDRERSGDGEVQGQGSAAGGMMSGAQGEQRTMASYVNAGKMQQVRETCKSTHATQVQRFEELVDKMEELQLQSAAERAAADDTVHAVMAEFESGVERLQAAVHRLEEMFGSGKEGYNFSQDLMELDSAMREDLAALTDVKNDFTLDLHVHIKQVATFQVRIAELAGPLSEIEDELGSKAAFPHLQRLHQLPYAYAATVVEVVRRKELAELLAGLAQRVNAEMATCLGTERERRAEVRAAALSQLPWSVTALEEEALGFEIVGVQRNEMLESLHVGRRDVENLQREIYALSADRELGVTILDREDSPLPPLQSYVDELAGALDGADKTFSDALLMAIAPDVAQRLAHAEEDAATSAARADAAESRENELQAQLGEQHAEMTRWDESHVPRQEFDWLESAHRALGAELEDKTRENERERDDHAEVIAGLTAELGQEKSRATDLGVRLQEALLDVDGLRSGEQALQVQLHGLQDERSRLLAALSEAQQRTSATEGEMARMGAELSAMGEQLAQTRVERDAALRNQSAEAERMMRDHIAEADGDRAVLEHQNLTLGKEVEDLKVEMEQKLSTARNAAVRAADGLKAELSFTKAQLRDAQRRESVLADELAMARDAQTAMTSKDAHSSDVAKDAVVLAGRYHETCTRLAAAVVAATGAVSSSSALGGVGGSTLGMSTFSPGEAGLSVLVAQSPAADRDAMKESGLVRSLATASTFDLAGFGDAVLRLAALTKKLHKTCRHYRDQARHKISFTAFAKGDLALFLPTRNASTRPWMAYNVATPHHFLRLPLPAQAQGDGAQGTGHGVYEGRDSIVARITGTEEAVAGDTPRTNPFGLAEGLRFYIHTADEYVPSSRARRSTLGSVHASHGAKGKARASASEPSLSRFVPVDVGKGDGDGDGAARDPEAEAEAEGLETGPEDSSKDGDSGDGEVEDMRATLQATKSSPSVVPAPTVGLDALVSSPEPESGDEAGLGGASQTPRDNSRSVSPPVSQPPPPRLSPVLEGLTLPKAAPTARAGAKPSMAAIQPFAGLPTITTPSRAHSPTANTGWTPVLPPFAVRPGVRPSGVGSPSVPAPRVSGAIPSGTGAGAIDGLPSGGTSSRAPALPLHGRSMSRSSRSSLTSPPLGTSPTPALAVRPGSRTSAYSLASAGTAGLAGMIPAKGALAPALATATATATGAGAGVGGVAGEGDALGRSATASPQGQGQSTGMSSSPSVDQGLGLGVGPASGSGSGTGLLGRVRQGGSEAGLSAGRGVGVGVGGRGEEGSSKVPSIPFPARSPPSPLFASPTSPGSSPDAVTQVGAGAGIERKSSGGGNLWTLSRKRLTSFGFGAGAGGAGTSPPMGQGQAEGGGRASDGAGAGAGAGTGTGERASRRPSLRDGPGRSSAEDMLRRFE